MKLCELGDFYVCMVPLFLYAFFFSSFMHDVMVCILLAICNSHVLHVGSVLPCLKALGEIKCYVRFFVPRDPVKTLSLV